MQPNERRLVGVGEIVVGDRITRRRAQLAAVYESYNRDVDAMLGWDTLNGKPGTNTKWISE